MQITIIYIGTKKRQRNTDPDLLLIVGSLARDQQTKHAGHVRLMLVLSLVRGFLLSANTKYQATYEIQKLFFARRPLEI